MLYPLSYGDVLNTTDVILTHNAQKYEDAPYRRSQRGRDVGGGLWRLVYNHANEGTRTVHTFNTVQLDV